MNNTALKSEIWITVKYLSDISNVHLTTIRRRLQSGKYTSRLVDGKGGKQYEILLSSVEPELQEKFLSSQPNNSLSEQEVSQILPIGKMLPAISLKIPAARKVVPDKAKEIGLARYDALLAWEEFRNKASKKAEADKDFVALFNSGVYYPELYKIINEISIGTLYRWKKDVKEGKNYTALIPQYNYRSNFEIESKLTESERHYFLDLLLKPSKISIGNATRLVKYVLEKQGITSLSSDITYRRFANKFQKNNYDVWVLMREGQKALIDKVAPYVERDTSVLNVGDVLVADGHTLDFMVVNPFDGKPCRATLVGYMDWASNALIGYEIMLTENTQCIASALRNAIINLGKIPKICYQDNGKAFRSKFFEGSKNFDECGFNGLFGKLGIVPVFAKPYNAKAKTIERFWREFSETCERLLPSYCGNNVSNKPAYMMRNEKFHKEIHSKFVPTIQQAVKLIDAWMDFHQSQPCPHQPDKTIGQVFNEGKGEGVDLELLDELMMAEKVRKIHRNGVKFLNNNYYSTKICGIKGSVVIKYSLFDLSYVKIYTQNGEYICKAETNLKVHPMAHHLGEAKDVNSLKAAIKLSKKQQSITMKKAKSIRKVLSSVDGSQIEWQNDVIEAEVLPAIENKQNEYEFEKMIDLIPQNQLKQVYEF